MKRLGNGFFLAAALAGLGLPAAGSREARAGFTINLQSVSPILSGVNAGDFTWTYQAQITGDDSINSTHSDFFRIYDFTGYVPGTITAPAGWTATTSLSNPTPPPSVILTHGDDPAIPNLIFTFNQGAATIAGPAAVNNFSAVSFFGFGGSGTKDAVGSLTKQTSPQSGTPVDSRNDVAVPVPEPASLVSGGIGMILLGIGYAYRCRRKLSA